LHITSIPKISQKQVFIIFFLMTSLYRFLQPYFSHGRLAVLRFFRTMMWWVYNIILVWCIGQTITAIEGWNTDQFWRYLWVMGWWFIIYQAYNARHPKIAYNDHYLKQRIYNHVMTRFFSLDPNACEKIGTGRLINIVQTGIDKRTEALMQLNTHIPWLLVTFAYFFWITSSKGWQYVIGSVAIFSLVGLIMYLLQRKGIVERRKQKNVEGEMTRNFVKGVMHKFGIMMADGVQHELDQFHLLSEDRLRRRRRRHKYLHANYLVGEVFVTGMRMATLGIGGMMVFAGTMSFGEIGAMLVLLGFLNQGIHTMDQVSQTFWKEWWQIEALWDFLDTTPVVENLHTGKTLQYRGGDIVFEKVGFGYSKEKNIFTDFACRIEWGKKTALVWPSGGGKSTLIKMIAWYLRPDNGKIVVEWVDRAEYSLSSWYANVGYLTQEPSVFDGTVRENLLYWVQKISEGSESSDMCGVQKSSEVWWKSGSSESSEHSILDIILQKSQCHFVYDLPNWLDTEIGERGVRLSWWQRQRLAIAKIMLKNPKIILLDEPTSALDSVSEELVSQAMQELFKDRTVVIIAHRLQTVKHADRILYITPTPLTGASEIAESWTHDELIALGGKYAKMVEVQTGF